MWERATLLLREMEEDGTTPETPAYKSVLETIRDAGQWEQVSVVTSRNSERAGCTTLFLRTNLFPASTCFSNHV